MSYRFVESERIEISYPTLNGWEYWLEKSAHLEGASWSALSPVEIGDGRTIQFEENLSLGRGFYRLQRKVRTHEIFSEAEISTEEASYTVATWTDTAIAICKKRFPAAAWIIEQDREFFEVWFPDGRDRWGEKIDRLDSAIHESVHGVTGWVDGFENYEIVMGPEHSLVVPWDRDGMPRSAIIPRIPEPVLTNTNYAEVYLTDFSGTQNFATVLNELNAYTYSLLVKLAFLDQIPPQTSTRAGLLTLMLYTQLYLKAARLDEPQKYAELVQNKQMVNATQVFWARAIEALERSGDDQRLSYLAEYLRPYVFAEANLDEIARLPALY